MDRRIKRTRTAVFNAVMELLVEKDSNKITVLELCDRADINKSTFYLHYDSLEDCMQKCFRVIMNGIMELAKSVNLNDLKFNPEPIVNGLLDEVEKNLDYIIRFKDSNICSPATKAIKKNLVSSIMEANGFSKEENYDIYLSLTFATAGCFDSVIEPLPEFNKQAISESICKMLKKM